MPNVYRGEAEFVDMFITYVRGDDHEDLSVFDSYRVPYDERPLLLRDRSVSDVAYQLALALSEYCGYDSFPFELADYNPDNRDGSDLLVFSNIEDRYIPIELKLGNATDINPGFSAIFEYVLGSGKPSWSVDPLALIMQARSKRILLPDGSEGGKWRERYIQAVRNDREEDAAVDISEEMQVILHAASDDYASRLLNAQLPEDGCRLMNGYSSGITNAKKAIAHSKGNRGVTRFVLGCDELNDDVFWECREPHSVYSRDWYYEGFDVSPAGRFVFFVFDSVSRLHMKFTLNWKNNYPIKNTNIKAPAKLGLGSPSWIANWVLPEDYIGIDECYEGVESYDEEDPIVDDDTV